MKKLIILSFVICFTMCKQKPLIATGDGIFVDMDRPEKASLFDYFRSIELIPLETSPDALITGISKIVIHQDNYYALDKRQCILFVFDKTGRFLFKIDKKGQGVGEYRFIQDFNINPFSGNLEILEPYGDVHVFDLSGNYIEKKTITFPGFRVVHTIAALDSATHVFYSMFQPKKIIYFNSDEGKLLHEEFEESEELGCFSNFPYQYQDEWYFSRPIHPVVYRMGKKGLETAFQFDFGKYTRENTSITFSDEGKRILSKTIEELFNQSSYLLQAVRHNNRYIFASLHWKDINRRANIIYDKSAGESKFILDFTENVVFNSYAGEEIIVTDEYVLMPSQWIDLDQRLKKEMLDEKQQEIFEELLHADMELNPILIKYRFK